MDRAEPNYETKKKSYRNLKICCLVTFILILITAIVLVILYFTIFKPKEPKILTRSVTLENFKAEWPQLFLNVTFGFGITIDNRNYGGFKYGNSTVFVNYRDKVIGEAPIVADTVRARKKYDVNSSVTIFANLLFEDANFLHDFVVLGVLNFTTDSTLHGKASLLNLFKMEATILTNCEISLFVVAEKAESFCKSKTRF